MPNVEWIGASSANYTAGRSGYSVTHLAIHYTATNASARNNAIYFSRPGAGASAHYFIDGGGTIYQSVSENDTAWAVGNWTMNCKSISIEVVSAGQDFTSAEIAELTWLTQDIMKRYGIPASRVIRHYDVTGKHCPAPYVNSSKWNALHAQITSGATDGGSYNPPSTPSAPTESAGKVNVWYEGYDDTHGWLGEVCNYNNSNGDGFAGWPHYGMKAIRIRVDKGAIKYRVHVIGGGWLPWVTGSDRNDFNNGYAGDGAGGRYIDGIQIYYETPSGKAYQQAWYRSQTTARAGWLATCCDDGNSISGYDGWAGMYGEPMDRLQISIGDSAPF